MKRLFVFTLIACLLVCSQALAAPGTPTISGVSPTAIAPGPVKITVTGTNFTNVRSVGGYNASTNQLVGNGSFSVASSTQLTVSGSLNAGTYYLKVTTVYGTSNASPVISVTSSSQSTPSKPSSSGIGNISGAVNIGGAYVSVAKTGFTANFCLDGNSFTYGTENGATPYWTSDGRFKINCTPTFNDISAGLATTPDLLKNDPTTADPLISKSYGFNIYIPWDPILADVVLNNASVNTALANYVNLCNARRAAGWRVVAVTMMPTGWSASPPKPADFEDRRTQINTWLRANWQTFADALADPASDPKIGQALSYQNPTYYAAVDQVHLTTAGNIIAAQYIGKAINSILGATVQADVNGKYSFGSLDTGAYVETSWAATYKAVQQNVNVTAGNTTIGNFTLPSE